MTTGTTLANFLERAGQLYSLPAVAIEVLELTQKPKVDVPALKRCIENDPALTAKILRVVNSSLFGLSREVSDLNQALALLGIKPLKMLVLGFSLAQSSTQRPTSQAMQRYWRRTLTLAVASRELASRLYRIPGDEPFIAALLQDLGELVLLQELGEPYAQLLARAAERGAGLGEVEERVLGFSHRTLTIELLTAWKLPPVLIRAIGSADHADEPNARERREQLIAGVLRTAQKLVDLVVDGREAALAELVESVPATAAMSPDILENLAAALSEKVGELAEVFAVQLPPGSDYRDILVRAQQQLAVVSSFAAGDLLRHELHADETALWREAEAVDQAMREFLKKCSATTDIVRREKCLGGAVSKVGPPDHVRSTRVRSTRRQNAAESTDLTKALVAAVATCRQNRCALTLALVELDGYEHIVQGAGPIAAEQQSKRLATACQGIGGVVISTGQAQLAMIWTNCDRSQATQWAQDLLRRAMAELRRKPEEPYGSTTVSVGVATVTLPPKNFPPGELVESATRCLSAAQLSGGNTVKSIGVF
jgi:HD-like signal output (HDOD) protein